MEREGVGIIVTTSLTLAEENMYKQLLNLVNPVQRRGRDVKWRLNNADRIRDQHARHELKNPALLREKSRLRGIKWRLDNPERFKSTRLRYRTINSHLYAAMRSRRRARQRNGKAHDSQKIRSIYKRAAELRKYFDVCVDHIIPLARGGPHTADNLQIIYAADNRRKGHFFSYTPQIVFR